MLSIIAREEEPKDEDEKLRIMEDNRVNRQKKSDIETTILNLLKNTEGSKILDDEKLLLTLSESKQTSLEIQDKIQASQVTEDKINANRQHYSIVAKLASAYYFTMLKLKGLDCMYEFSLAFYIKVINILIMMQFTLFKLFLQRFI